MKNIIHKLKFVTIAALTLSLGSCDSILDQDVLDYGAGPNIVRFQNTSLTVPIEVPGEPKVYNAPIAMVGPNLTGMTEDITVTFEVDAAATSAVEGVDYDIASNTVTLTAENDYQASVPITLYTEHVTPPHTESLKLTITEFSTTANDNIVISGIRQSTSLNLSWICFADLTGTYTMTNTACSAEVTDVTITKNEDGGWDLSTADGGLLQYCTSNTGLVNDGSIIVVCGAVEASDDLAFCGSNGIGCITGGTWNEETGTLELVHNDTFFGVGEYTSTYVRTSTEVAE